MQLVAYGAQDVYLTGNPQITFFKVVYRRHTNFSMECIQQTINGSQTATDNNSGTVTISRNGDLVHKVFVTVPADKAKTNGSGTVKEVELEIGGQRIDRHTEEYMNVVNELTTPESKAIGLKVMMSDAGTQGTAADNTGVQSLHVPLQFWFCRNPGLALPLIALQYHEVKLKFTWGSGGSAGGTCQVWCDYIYLDTDERRRFAQVSHEYLIEQVQYHNATATTSHKLNFNHPVKELIWTTAADNNYTSARLTLNGHDRFANQPVEYFQLKQPLDHHTAVPRQNLPLEAKIPLATYTIGDNTLGVALVGRNTGNVTNTNGTSIGTGDMIIATLEGETSDTVVTDSDYIATSTQAAYETNTREKQAGHIMVSAEALAFRPGPVLLEGTKLGPNSDQTLLFCNVLKVGPLGDGNATSTHTADRAVFFDRTILKIGATSFNQASYDDFTITKVRPITIDPSPAIQARTSAMTREINCYSFALKPEEHQPSGTCNFSRIDTAKLETGSALTADDVIYAVNYNVLRIMSGMGGLAYSN